MTDKMKPYIGVKRVNARPMTRGEYNKFRGWSLPDGEIADDAGYLIEYANSEVQPELGGKANGYVSWSPKTVFEDSYANVSQFGGGWSSVRTHGRKHSTCRLW